MGKKTLTGKYRGKVTIGVDQNGNSIYKYVSAPTRRELQIVKAAVKEHFIFGREIPKDQQFCEYAEQWYTLKKEPFISDASRTSYKSCFMKHILPEFGLQQMKAISSAQIQEFVNGFARTSKSTDYDDHRYAETDILICLCRRDDRARSDGCAYPAEGIKEGCSSPADERGNGSSARSHTNPSGRDVSGGALLPGLAPRGGAWAQMGRL